MEWIKKIIGMTKLEDEVYKKTKELTELQQRIEIISGANHQLALQVINLEDDLEKVKAEPEAYIEEQLSLRLIELEAEFEDKRNHRWYAQGRQDAYAEMGIRNIEAHEMGGFLAIMPDGEAVPLLSLEDFNEIKAKQSEEIIDDSTGMAYAIIIDDLIDQEMKDDINSVKE